MIRKLLVPLALAAAIVAPRAEAFCGFYVAPSDAPLYADATMVALMREGTRTVLSMSNNYKGPAADFAMIVPVPVVLKKENVKTLPHDTFKHLEELSAPRLVEYWEQDPCTPDIYPSESGGPYPPTAPMSAGAPAAEPANYGVKIEAKFAVGEYEILVLSASQSDGLESWLHDSGYKIPKGASSALAPYVKEQMKFFVAKIDIKKVQMDKQGVAVLSPLRFNYESQDFRLPVRLGLLNSPSKQDLIVFVLGKGKRYETANYPNAFIPTNLDVADETRNAFGPFYATLFDATVGKSGGRAVVTEYSWETSSCDPCPTPPLDDNDVATLGGDVLLGMGTPPPAPPNGGAPMPMGGPGGGYYGGGNGMVLTRLHARYDATTLTEDLVFKAVDPVVGGREFVVGDQGDLEKGAKADPSGINNFQGRYAIRHKWTGPITCSKPKRNVWGGPPAGVNGSTSPMPATNLAAAPRGAVKLAAYVRKGLDDPESWDRAAMEQSGVPGALGPRRACGCEMPGRSTTWGLAGVGILAAAAVIAIRRGKKS